VQLNDAITGFLRQGMEEEAPLQLSWARLAQILQS
jgi:hypothetical protein